MISQQKTLQEELIRATKVLEEGSTRTAEAMNNRELNGIDTAEVFITAGNAKLIVLKNQLIENSEKLNRLRKKYKNKKKTIEINII